MPKIASYINKIKELNCEYDINQIKKDMGFPYIFFCLTPYWGKKEKTNIAVDIRGGKNIDKNSSERSLLTYFVTHPGRERWDYVI